MQHATVPDVNSATPWGQPLITVACSCGTRVTVNGDTGSEPYQQAVAAITRHVATAA